MSSNQNGQSDDEKDPFLCRIGWHNTKPAGRVNQAGSKMFVCSRCGEVKWI